MASWQYQPAPDLNQPLVERLRRFPREPDLTVYALRSAAAVLTRIWLKLYHRLEIAGAEHIPEAGSFVMVANHSSHLDTLCLLSALPLARLHQAFPAAAQDYFFTSVPRLAFSAIYVNALPFGRQAHIRETLDLCRQLLAGPGNILILFPEGTRTTTGRMAEFKPGIGLLVAGTNIPVLPCHLRGAFEAWPKGRLWARPGRIQVRIGAPRQFSACPRSKEACLQIGRDLRQAVLDLGS